MKNGLMSTLEESRRRKSTSETGTLPASCLKLTELLVGVKDNDALSSLVCAMGHVLLEVYTEVKSMSQIKKSNRDSMVNKLLYERRISTEKMDTKNSIPEKTEPSPPLSQRSTPSSPLSQRSTPSSPLSQRNTSKSPASNERISTFIKRPVHRTSQLERDSSIEYVTPKRDVPNSLELNPPKPEPRSRTSRRGSIDVTLEHLADCKSIIDTILDSDKKAPSKDEKPLTSPDSVSQSLTDKTPTPKNTLQVPDILSSDSETPKPQQLSRQSSFKRQKSFRKKKSRTRAPSLNATSACESSACESSSTEMKIPRRSQLSINRSKTSTYLDVTSKSKLDLKKDRSRKSSVSDNNASSDERAWSVFSSDGESYASDSSKTRRIRDKLALHRNKVPFYFSELESDTVPEPVELITPEPVVNPVETETRTIKMVRSGSACYVTPFTTPDIPSRDDKSFKNIPKVPKRLKRMLDTTSLGTPANKETTENKRLSAPVDEKKMKPGGLKRYSAAKNNQQQKMLTSALKSVLAFTQITNDHDSKFEIEGFSFIDYT